MGTRCIEGKGQEVSSFEFIIWVTVVAYFIALAYRLHEDQVWILGRNYLPRVFDIGTEVHYFVPGKLMANATMGRVHFDGSALMRALYETDNAISNVKVPEYPIGVLVTPQRRPRRHSFLDGATVCPPGV